MTIELNQERRDRALDPPAATPTTGRGSGRLVVATATVAAVALAGGLTLVGFDVAAPHGMRFAVYAAGCFVLAGVAAAVLCVHALLADRGKFYQRGQLDGWMKGWRGQAPDVDDPLAK